MGKDFRVRLRTCFIPVTLLLTLTLNDVRAEDFVDAESDQLTSTDGQQTGAVVEQVSVVVDLGGEAAPSIATVDAQSSDATESDPVLQGSTEQVVAEQITTEQPSAELSAETIQLAGETEAAGGDAGGVGSDSVAVDVPNLPYCPETIEPRHPPSPAGPPPAPPGSLDDFMPRPVDTPKMSRCGCAFTDFTLNQAFTPYTKSCTPNPVDRCELVGPEVVTTIGVGCDWNGTSCSVTTSTTRRPYSCDAPQNGSCPPAVSVESSITQCRAVCRVRGTDEVRCGVQAEETIRIRRDCQFVGGGPPGNDGIGITACNDDAPMCQGSCRRHILRAANNCQPDLQSDVPGAAFLTCVDSSIINGGVSPNDPAAAEQGVPATPAGTAASEAEVPAAEPASPPAAVEQGPEGEATTSQTE